MEMLHIRLPKEMHRKLKLFAVSNGTSMTALIGSLIERCLKDYKKEAA